MAGLVFVLCIRASHCFISSCHLSEGLTSENHPERESSQLNVAVQPPALYLIIHQQGTRVGVAARDARDLNEGGALGGGPVPELAVAVGVPTLYLIIHQQGTRICS